MKKQKKTRPNSSFQQLSFSRLGVADWRKQLDWLRTMSHTAVRVFTRSYQDAFSYEFSCTPLLVISVAAAGKFTHLNFRSQRYLLGIKSPQEMDGIRTVDNIRDWITNGPRRTMEDLDALINQVNQPSRNPAPRGKRIIHPNQARYLYFDVSQEIASRSQDSTLTESVVDKTSIGPNASSSFDRSKSNVSLWKTPVREDRRLSSDELHAKKLEKLRERQLEFDKQEMALGGYHNVFEDSCPIFEPQKYTDGEDSSMTSDTESVQSERNDATFVLRDHVPDDGELEPNIARSSQGRVGEGCSTPRNIVNHTFEPLREIDVSVVKAHDSASTEVCSKGTFTVETRKMSEKVLTLDTKSSSLEGAGPVAGTDELTLPNADDSMENVLSKMRVTPKKINSVNKRSLFTRLENKPEHETSQNVAMSGSSSAVEAQVKEPVMNETHVVEESTNRGKSANILNEEQNAPAEPPSNAKSSADVVFAVPAIPTKTSKGTAKTTVQQREERAKKNSSILETMSLELRSPGRTLFAALPPKKKVSLATTPVKATPSHNEEAMEISIEMSDISQQPSVETSDNSMVDPVTDPRPSQLPSTPSRVIRPPIASSSLSVTPLNTAKTLPRHSGSQMSASERMEIIRKSVERLSQPRQSGSCSRTCERSVPKEQITPHPNGADNNNCGGEPMTPFQPIDHSRMFSFNVDRSGTSRRGPRTRFQKSGLSRSSLFPQETEDTSRQMRRNLLKRQGDYKPKESDKDDLCPAKVAAEPPHDEQSPRIPAGKNALPPTSFETVEDINENILSEAASRLSLQDTSPARAADGGNDGAEFREQSANSGGNEGLLVDSVFSTNTPGRESPIVEHIAFASEQEVDSGISTVETTAPEPSSNASAEAGSSGISVGGRKNKDIVMVLKPRTVVVPSTPTTPNVRRSVRNRMKPVRQWLGERPVYKVSPGGGRTLVGVNQVEVKDKRWVKFKTADFQLATEREKRLAAHRRLLREKRKQEARERKKSRLLDLEERHRRGVDLDITADSIVTSSDDEDSD
ncbi:hypothetical protein KIN20_020675 [Parelaphostrongylus tenuis]|uniref:Uncharacterized protein n=1 Tax=Parelaphostrongylus tenuis TaxID=148309 RepID=A0AAD5N6Z2_PARTN|nr:hypothetical protein KIN20_020675 [Parelaphostrongylus tenuis]